MTSIKESPANNDFKGKKKSVLKITYQYFYRSIVAILTILFCLVFTEPGNKFIAFSVNYFVPNVTVKLEEGRFLYQDPFSISFDNSRVKLEADNLTLKLNIWQCLVAYSQNTDAVCLENMSFEKAFVAYENSKVKINKLNFRLSLMKGISSPSLNFNHIRINNILINQLSNKTEKHSYSTLIFEPISDILLKTPIDIKLTRFSLNQLEIIQNTSEHLVNNIELQSSFISNKLTLQQLDLSYQDIQIKAEGNLKFIHNNPIHFNIQLEKGSKKTNLYSLEAKVLGDFSNLKIDLKTNGKYSSKHDARLNLKQQNYPFSLQTEIENWQYHIDDKVIKLIDLGLFVEGSLKAYNINLMSQQGINAFPLIDLNLTGKGDLSQFTFDKLRINTAKSDVSLKGSIEFEDQFVANLTGEINKLNLHDFMADYNSELSGAFSTHFKQNNEKWLLSVEQFDLGGVFSVSEGQDIHLNLVSQFLFDEKGNAEINRISLQSGVNYLSLAGNIDDNWQLAGKLSLTQASQISSELSGIGLGSIKISGQRLKPEINWLFDFKDIIYQNTKVKQAQLQGLVSLRDDFENKISLFLENAEFKGKEIKTLALNAFGNKNKHHADFNVNSDWGNSYFELNGVIKNDLWTSKVSNLLLSDNTITFKPLSDIDLQIDLHKQSAQLQPHCWQSLDSQFCIDEFDISEKNGEVQIDLNQFDLKTIAHLLPESLMLKGQVLGEFHANWQQGKLKAITTVLDSKLIEIALQQDEKHFKLPINNIHLSLDGDTQKANISTLLSSELFGKFESKLIISDILEQRFLDGFIKLDGFKLDKFKPFIQKLDTLAGDVQGDINIAGSLLHPLLSGDLVAEHIALSGVDIPVSITNSNLAIAFEEQKLNMQADIFDDQQGKAKLTGTLNWKPSLIEGKLNIIGKDFNLTPEKGIKLKLDPALELIISNNQLDIIGKVSVPYGRIEIADLPKGAVRITDDQVILEHKKIKKDPKINYALDLAIAIKEDVKIDSFGLTSELSGNMFLKKAHKGPLLATGSVDLIDGVYQSFGQELQIQTGQVGFSGAIDKPYLNIKAIRDPDKTADEVIAGVRLTGNIDKPKLDIFSEPTQDQAQALSYLLNGQPLGEDNNSNSSLLTQLLLSKSLSRSESLVSKIGSKLGIKDISLGSTGSGDDTKVEISGYLLPGVQVRYSVGVFDPFTEVVIRYQLLPQLYIEAINGVYKSLDILYKFDWD